MLGGITAPQVYIVCGYTDMRRSIDALAAIVKQHMNLNPFDKSLFLFCGKRRDRLKFLTREQFVWLMQGLSIKQPKAIKKKIPKDIF